MRRILLGHSLQQGGKGEAFQAPNRSDAARRICCLTIEREGPTVRLLRAISFPPGRAGMDNETPASLRVRA